MMANGRKNWDVFAQGRISVCNRGIIINMMISIPDSNIDPKIAIYARRAYWYYVNMGNSRDRS